MFMVQRMFRTSYAKAFLGFSQDISTNMFKDLFSLGMHSCIGTKYVLLYSLGE